MRLSLYVKKEAELIKLHKMQDSSIRFLKENHFNIKAYTYSNKCMYYAKKMYYAKINQKKNVVVILI